MSLPNEISAYPTFTNYNLLFKYNFYNLSNDPYL